MSHPDMRKDKPVGLRTFKMGDEYHHKIVVKEAGYVNDVSKLLFFFSLKNADFLSWKRSELLHSSILNSHLMVVLYA